MKKPRRGTQKVSPRTPFGYHEGMKAKRIHTGLLIAGLALADVVGASIYLPLHDAKTSEFRVAIGLVMAGLIAATIGAVGVLRSKRKPSE